MLLPLKPKSESSIKTLLLLALVGAAFAQDTVPVSVKDMDAQFPYQESVARSNERIFTMPFLGTIALAGFATGLDSFKTSQLMGQHGCLEGANGFPERVTNKEIIVNNLVEFSVITGLEIGFRATRPPKWLRPASYGGSIAEIVAHTRGAYSWYAHCS